MEKLTPATEAEQELLTVLIEELAETIQSCSKISRFGWDSINPAIPNSLTNRHDLEKELGNVHNAVMMLINKGLISEEAIIKSAEEKALKIHQFLFHQ